MHMNSQKNQNNENKTFSDVSIKNGWTCPKCNRVFSSNVEECKYCNKGIDENVNKCLENMDRLDESK